MRRLTGEPGSGISIALVITDKMMATGTLLPLEMWHTADMAWASRARGAGRLNTSLVGLDSMPVETQSGRHLIPDRTVRDADEYAVIYLPSLWRDPVQSARHARALTPWLRTRYKAGAIIAAVGTGATLLAQTGLLDGRAATTHWHFFDRFERLFPAVELKRDFFITQADNLYCAASINALADVTVHLIERFYGYPTAAHTERQFSYEVRRPFEKYGYLSGQTRQHSDELVAGVQSWLTDRLSEPLRLSEVAGRFGVSTRTLLRRFERATSTTPGRYLQHQRLDVAKGLLQATNLAIGEVAGRVGFADQRQFARIFRQREGVSPREFRSAVRAKLFSAMP